MLDWFGRILGKSIFIMFKCQIFKIFQVCLVTVMFVFNSRSEMIHRLRRGGFDWANTEL